jgi:hypothetical protein
MTVGRLFACREPIQWQGESRSAPPLLRWSGNDASTRCSTERSARRDGSLPGRWRAPEEWNGQSPIVVRIVVRAELVDRAGAANGAAFEFENGGEGGIRTHETVARLRHFQCRALDRTRRPLRPRQTKVYRWAFEALGLHLGAVLAPLSVEAPLLVEPPVRVRAEVVPETLHQVGRQSLTTISVVVGQG